MTSSGSTLLFGAIPKHLKPTAGEKRTLAQFMDLLGERVAGACSFVCLLADDAHLRQLNNGFLGRDYATDVLSFPASAKNFGTSRLRSEPRASASGSEEAACLGEMAISMERAVAQAAEFGNSWLDEVRILMLHGVLHLTGLDHETGDAAMARAEKYWRAEFNLPETLIARANRPRRRLSKMAKGAA